MRDKHEKLKVKICETRKYLNSNMHEHVWFALRAHTPSKPALDTGFLFNIHKSLQVINRRYQFVDEYK